MNQDLNKEPKEYVDYEEQYKELIEEEKEKASRSMFVRMLIIFVIILLLLLGSTFLYLKMYGDRQDITMVLVKSIVIQIMTVSVIGIVIQMETALLI